MILPFLAALLAPIVLAVARPLADALAGGGPFRLPPRGWRPWLGAGSPGAAALASGVAAVVAARWSSRPVAALVVLAALAVVLLAALVDRRCHRLPDVLVVPLGAGLVTGIGAWSMATGQQWRLGAALGAGLVAGAILGVGWLVGMGLGDVKFGVVLGVLVGWPADSGALAVAAALGVVGTASLMASAWWAATALSPRPTPRWFPFGPFLAGGAVGVLLVIGPPMGVSDPSATGEEGTAPVTAPACCAEPVRPATPAHR